MSTLLHSSDSHVYEPADLFTSRVPAKLRHSAMRWQFFDGGSRGGFYDACVAYKTGDEPQPFIAVSRPRTADGSYLVGGVEERVRALNFDGIGFEVLHPNLAMSIYNIA